MIATVICTSFLFGAFQEVQQLHVVLLEFIVACVNVNFPFPRYRYEGMRKEYHPLHEPPCTHVQRILLCKKALANIKLLHMPNIMS